MKDPGSFTIPCTIGILTISRALCDFRASINLMPLSLYRKCDIGEVQLTTVSLQLVDRSLTYLGSVVEDVLVKVGKFIFLVDFMVLDMEEDSEVPIILGWLFLATGRALIDVQEGKLSLRVNDEKVKFNIFHSLKYVEFDSTCYRVDVVDRNVAEFQELALSTDHLS
ncbi:uncharacterized protein LOC120076237 [Benincasa hispida]|uniref:uncharacterized protein LOC120076237 n=1 Tax=Benincasa hispida TaxID=102211 RepID=UPI0019002DCC|nr:uncharacterized protein LOC120076237 [Benincasa hispida]